MSRRASDGKVRVAQVVTKFLAGAGGVAFRGALALDSDRYSVTILARDGGPLLGRAEASEMEVVRLRHMRPEINPLEDVRCLRELTLELGSRGFDLVHTHSAKAGALGRLAARRAGVPAVVHTFHGFPFHEFQSPARRSAYIAIERSLGRITNRFLAVGASVAAEAIRLGIAAPERVRTIASAIDSSIHRRSVASRAAARRLMGLPLHATVIGSVGRLDLQKAPSDMLRAFLGLGRPGIHFVWVGDGPLRPALEREIARRGIGDRFHLMGERSDVGALLPGFDLFAMSSKYEGLPCSLVEAITCSVPVVATAVNAVPEVVIPGRTGLLVPPAAPRALSRAIGYLLDHPDEANRMARTARAQVDGRFRPELLGRDLEETYQLALADSGERTTSRRPVARPA